MRRIWLVLACLAAMPNVVAAVTADEIVRISPSRLAWLIALRQGTLESAVQIEPHPYTMAQVSFHVPPDIHPAGTYRFGARYLPTTRSFIFNPKYYAALNRWQGDQPAEMEYFLTVEESFRQAIDHEVGHAIVHDVAIRSGLLDWYLPAVRADWSADQVIGQKILLEGLGTYFERLTDPERVIQGLAIMPSTWRDPTWYSRFEELCYNGGHWIVYPIVDAHGVRGIQYILSHPLMIPNGDAYMAAVEYQKTALINLSGN